MPIQPDRTRCSAPARVLAPALLALVALLALLGSAQAQLRIVVTLPPYVDLLQRLAGPDATVVGLLPAGASPHSFDPSPRALIEIERADVVIVNGGLDAWALQLVAGSSGDATVVEVLDLPAAQPLAGGDHAHDEDDDEHDEHDDASPREGAHDDVNPHVWLDPLRMRGIVAELAEALAAADLERAADYRANAAALQAQLTALHAELAAVLAPVAGAPFVPFHDAWPYFAERYGLDLVLEIEPFPGREPSPSYLVAALDAIRVSGARAIFAEAQLSRRPAEVIAAEAGVRLAVLDPLGGGEGLQAYEALLRYNAETIASALSEAIR